MKLYRTKEDNLINLDNVSVIYKNPEDGTYRVACLDGKIYEMPEITKEDIDRISEYNNYLID